MAIHSDSLKQRRRRVTRDQSLPSARTQTRPVSKKAKSTPATRKHGGKGLYASGARRNHQLRTTDLIPKRPGTVVLVSLFLLSLVGLLNAGHFFAPGLRSALGEPFARILDLGHSRSLANSYAGLVLFLACLASLQIYFLRMHRRDDYRGKYRIWIWIAGSCLVGGLVATSALFDLVRSYLFYDAGSAGHVVPWALLIKLAIAGLVAGRVIAEIRHSRLALGGIILLSLVCAIGIVLAHFPVWQSAAGDYVPALGTNLLLVASSILLVSLAGFARFVYLEANGMLRRKKKIAPEAGSADVAPAKTLRSKAKSKTDKEDTSEVGSESDIGSAKPTPVTAARDATSKPVPVPAKPAAPTPVSSRPAGGPLSGKIPSRGEPPRPPAKPDVRNSNPAPSKNDFELPDEDDDKDTKGLSKAERRRLRKLKRRAA